MNVQKTYKTIKSLEFQLMVYPNSRQQIIANAGQEFELDGEKHWFVVAEDGNCALFDKDCKIDDLSKVKTIASYMIREDIKSIKIPNSVKRIGEWAFSWCESLERIDIPDSVESIGYKAFYGCASLISIIIPNSVESIGYKAFYGCASLISIIILDSIESIGEYAFAGCDSLKEVIFKVKTLDEVESMDNYPWGIDNTSIIKAKF